MYKKAILSILLTLGLFVQPVLGYQIQRGDTLSGLARTYNTSVAEIAELNGITDVNTIYAGDEISIPGEDDIFGANPLPTDGFDSFLSAALNSSDTTIYVNALPDGVTSSIYTIFAADGRSVSEKVSCTGKSTSPSRLTGCSRGLSLTPNSDGSVDETAGTGSSHSKNARIAITDTINFTGKALAILNGSQATGANFLRVGTATTTGGNPCLAFDDGSSSTSTQICKDVSTDEIYWTTDGGSNTYSFTSSSITQLVASSTAGIGVTSGEIYVKASSTLGYTFDSDGNLFRAVSSTTGIEADSNGLKLNSSTISNLIATSTPTASRIPIADGGGKLADGWLNNPLPSAPTANDITYYSGSWLSAGVQTFIGSILNRAYIPNFSNFTETTAGGGSTSADKDIVIPFVLSTYNGGGTSAVLSMGGADGSKAFEINSVAKVTNTTAAANRGVALAGIADQISTFTAVADPAGYGGSTEVCWFQYENGTLSTVTKVAGVAVESNTIGAITVTNYNRYRIVWNETDVKFYVNGTLVATHTVRLPNANMDVIGVSARDASSSATTGIRADFASFTYIQDHT